MLSLSKQDVVGVLNEFLINLRTLIGNKPADCLLDSGASHKFLTLNWGKQKGIEIESNDQFGVKLADGQEVPALGKVRSLVDLGPMKTALTFYVLDCNVPCVLGIPYIQMVNPTIDWATRSVQIYTVSGLYPLTVVKRETIPSCEVVCAK